MLLCEPRVQPVTSRDGGVVQSLRQMLIRLVVPPGDWRKHTQLLEAALMLRVVLSTSDLGGHLPASETYYQKRIFRQGSVL